MASWFGHSMHQIISFRSGVGSLGGRFSAKKLPKEIIDFKKLVSEVHHNDPPIKCIDYYLQKISNISEKQIFNYELQNDIAKIIRHIQSSFEAFIKSQDLLEMCFSFLTSAMRTYVSSQRTDTAIFHIVCKIIQTNDKVVLSISNTFIELCLKEIELVDLFLTGDQLISIWSSCFISNYIAYQYYSSLFASAASHHKTKDLKSIEDFLDVVTNDFGENRINSKNLSMSMLFLGYIIRNVDTKNFLPCFFPQISELAPNSESLYFFEPLFTARTSEPTAVWSSLNDICSQKDLKIDLIESALEAISDSHSIPLPNVFTFTPFISRYKELKQESKEILFEILKKSDTSTKIDFLCSSMPLSQTGIDLELLEEVYENVEYGDRIDEVFCALLLDQQQEEVELCFRSNDSFFRIIEHTLDQIVPQSTQSIKLFTFFIHLVNDGLSFITHLIEQLLTKVDPDIYMTKLIDTIDQGISDKIFNIYRSASLEILSFNQIFFQNNGVKLIPKIVKAIGGLNFLAALVVDGPLEIVDDFIYEHFNETDLSKYDNNTLIHLMLGIHQNAPKESGFLRIPSLCAFVQNVPLNSPYDQYVFSSIAATKYLKPKKEQIHRFASRFIDSDLALTICKSPEYLPSITDPLFPHFILYQIHPGARNSEVHYQRPNSFSIWIEIFEISKETILMSMPCATLSIDCNSYITFGDNSVYCHLKEWHLFSFITTTDKSGRRILTCYFDAQKVSEVTTTNLDTITIGHKKVEAILFISPFLHTTNSILNQDDLLNLYQKGPINPTQKLMKSSQGVKLVPYRGILRYMHLFGGPHFIFKLMLDCETKDNFLFLVQSALNLFNLHAFEKTIFYASLHYVLRRRLDLISPQIEQILLLQFTKNGIDWSGLFECIGDIVIISSPNISPNFLLNLFKFNQITDASFRFCHLILDVIVFIKISDNLFSQFLQILELFIKAKPSILKKIALTIMSIPFCDREKLELVINDERFSNKQRKLVELLITAKDIYIEQFTFTESLWLAIKMNDDLCIDFLNFLADVCIEKGNYFNLSGLKKYSIHFYYLTKSENFWHFLFVLLLRKREKTFEDYLNNPIIELNIVPIMFELLPSIIQNEQNLNQGISKKVLDTLYCLLLKNSIKLTGMINSIQILCSLGFGEKPPFLYPFEIKSNVNIPRKTIHSKSNSMECQFNLELYKDYLNPELYELVEKHISKHPISLDMFEGLKPPTANNSNSIESIFQSDIVDSIALIATKLLIEVSSDINLFKKSIMSLLVFGADVDPKIAILMHRTIALHLLDEQKQLPNESLVYLIEFLMCRVCEGWWEDSVFDVFSCVINQITIKNKSLQWFIITCLFREIKNADKLKEMIYILIQQPVFDYCIQSPQFLDSFVDILSRNHFEGDHLILTKLKLDLKKYGNNNQTNSHFNELYQQIENETINSHQQIMNHRLEITKKPRENQILKFERENITTITYLRRAFRYEFFLHVNEDIVILEPAIISIFKCSLLMERCKAVPSTFSIISRGFPLSGTNRLIPLCFPYNPDFHKTDQLFSVPVSQFQNEIDTVTPELNLIHFAPKCLEGWFLPGHYTAGVTSMFKKIFKGVTDPFNMCILSSPDPLKCVGIMSNDSLCVLMNAHLSQTNVKTENEIELIEEKECLNHYPIFENGIQGILGDSSLFVGHVVLIIPFNIVNIVIPRTYCYQPIALDLYTANACHYSFVIHNKHIRELLMSKIKTINSIAARRGPGFSQRLLSKSIESVSKFWENGIMSNYDYLLYLNILAGRSFNDFSQYPVFPWIISDFTSNENPSTYRDLSKPMGQLNPEKAKKYDQVYQESAMPHYFYGTHYSYPVAVFYFLMRIEPMTLYNVVLHNGFDHPDRVFLSFAESWRSVSETNPADVKELIPEFYSSPVSFLNINHYQFPPRTDGTSIEQIILPPWSKNDPTLFIYQMRKALESEYASINLSKWIDLIFGFKQRGEESIKAKNVFLPQSYDDFLLNNSKQSKRKPLFKRTTISEEEVELTPDEMTIVNFGECPAQLFKTEHPSRTPHELATITETNLKVTKLRNFGQKVRNLRIYDDEIYATPKFSHYVGEPPKLVVVDEGTLEINGRSQYVEPVFEIESTNVSSDCFYMTIATKCGMVVNYWYNDDCFHFISKSLIPGCHFLNSAISSHFSIVIACTTDTVYMFDLTTGFLLRMVKTKTPVEFIRFCETNDFIICCEKLNIHIYDIYFNELATFSEFQDPITSLSTCDDVMWVEKPIFLSGHQSGYVYYWIFDMTNLIEDSSIGNELKIHKRKLEMKALPKLLDTPIVAVELLHGYRAVVCTDDLGNAYVVSTATIQRRVLKASEYETCALCGQKLIPSSSVICSICGLAYCKQCATAHPTSACKSCLITHREKLNSRMITSINAYKFDEN